MDRPSAGSDVVDNQSIAVVTHTASSTPQSFIGCCANEMEHVVDLAIGTVVYVLPSRIDDNGWTPIIYARWIDRAGFRSRREARRAWIHPNVWRYLPMPAASADVTVGHTAARGRNPASHDIGDEDPGVRLHGGVLVLDARWSGRGRNNPKNCSGFCSSYIWHAAGNAERMAHILDFASMRRKGVVACERATHRSVSAAKILELSFHRCINWSFATRRGVCSSCTAPNSDSVLDAMRHLPLVAADTDLLSYHLGLSNGSWL